MSPFEEFAPLLRARGFHKTWSTRAGGCRCDEWEKEIEDRTLKVQIWADRMQRITHSIRGNENTEPTYFTDEQGMREAITKETVRIDNLHHGKGPKP